MTRARTLTALRRGLQGLAFRGLCAAADGLVALAGLIGDGASVPAARPLASCRERMRATALRMLVEALLRRPLKPRERTVPLAIALAGALERAAVPAGWGPATTIESVREAALRQLVEAGLGRALEPGENAVGLALDLAARAREQGAGRLARIEAGARHVG